MADAAKPQAEFATEPKLFGKYSYNDIEILDKSMENYFSLFTTKARVFVPHTAGRWQVKRFRKAACPLVERLVGAIAFHGRNNGKKIKAIRIVRQALELIALQSEKNPIQVLADAICNGGPREDSTRIGSGGAVKRQAVDVSSFRRVNQAIYFLTVHAREKAFKNGKSIVETLADEILQASKNNQNCATVKKKYDIEKNAIANR